MIDICKEILLDLSHRIEPKKLQAGGAEVDPINHVIFQTGWPKRASVADALFQDPPGIRKVIVVLEGDPDHIPDVAWLVSNTDSEGQQIA